MAIVLLSERYNRAPDPADKVPRFFLLLLFYLIFCFVLIYTANFYISVAVVNDDRVGSCSVSQNRLMLSITAFVVVVV